MFCRSLFVLLSFFTWQLCCRSFFDLRILITPLVSSNSSPSYYCEKCSKLRCTSYSKYYLRWVKCSMLFFLLRASTICKLNVLIIYMYYLLWIMQKMNIWNFTGINDYFFRKTIGVMVHALLLLIKLRFPSLRLRWH